MGSLKLRQIFLILLSLIYIATGAFIVLSDVMPDKTWGIILAVLFIAYGSFRLYRALTLRENSMDAEEEQN